MAENLGTPEKLVIEDEYIAQMSYKQLQALAMSLKLPANLKQSAMIALIKAQRSEDIEQMHRIMSENKQWRSRSRVSGRSSSTSPVKEVVTLSPPISPPEYELQTTAVPLATSSPKSINENASQSLQANKEDVPQMKLELFKSEELKDNSLVANAEDIVCKEALAISMGSDKITGSCDISSDRSPDPLELESPSTYCTDSAENSMSSDFDPSKDSLGFPEKDGDVKDFTELKPVPPTELVDLSLPVPLMDFSMALRQSIGPLSPQHSLLHPISMSLTQALLPFPIMSETKDPLAGLCTPDSSMKGASANSSTLSYKAPEINYAQDQASKEPATSSTAVESIFGMQNSNMLKRPVVDTVTVSEVSPSKLRKTVINIHSSETAGLTVPFNPPASIPLITSQELLSKLPKSLTIVTLPSVATTSTAVTSTKTSVTPGPVTSSFSDGGTMVQSSSNPPIPAPLPNQGMTEEVKVSTACTPTVSSTSVLNTTRKTTKSTQSPAEFWPMQSKLSIPSEESNSKGLPLEPKQVSAKSSLSAPKGSIAGIRSSARQKPNIVKLPNPEMGIVYSEMRQIQFKPRISATNQLPPAKRPATTQISCGASHPRPNDNFRSASMPAMASTTTAFVHAPSTVTSSARSDQLNLPRSDQLNLPRSDQLSLPRSDQLSLPRSDQLNLPRSDQLNLPRSDQLNLPRSDQLNLPRSDQLNLPRPDQLNLPRSDQLTLPAPSVVHPTRNQPSAPPRPARPETGLNFAPTPNLPPFSHLSDLYVNQKQQTGSSQSFASVDTLVDALVQPTVDAVIVPPPAQTKTPQMDFPLAPAPVSQNLPVRPNLPFDSSTSTLRNILESPATSLQNRDASRRSLSNACEYDNQQSNPSAKPHAANPFKDIGTGQTGSGSLQMQNCLLAPTPFEAKTECTERAKTQDYVAQQFSGPSDLPKSLESIYNYQTDAQSTFSTSLIVASQHRTNSMDTLFFAPGPGLTKTVSYFVTSGSGLAQTVSSYKATVCSVRAKPFRSSVDTGSHQTGERYRVSQEFAPYSSNYPSEQSAEMYGAPLNAALTQPCQPPPPPWFPSNAAQPINQSWPQAVNLPPPPQRLTQPYRHFNPRIVPNHYFSPLKSFHPQNQGAVFNQHQLDNLAYQSMPPAQDFQSYQPRNIQAYQHRDTQSYQHQNPQSHQYRDMQSYQHPNPQSHQYRDMQSYQHRDPQSQYRDMQSYQHQNPQSHQYRDMQSYQHQNPQSHQHREMQSYQHQNPQSHQYRDMQSYQHRDPQSHQHREIQSYQHHDMQSYQARDLQSYQPRDAQPYHHREMQAYQPPESFDRVLPTQESTQVVNQDAISTSNEALNQIPVPQEVTDLQGRNDQLSLSLIYNYLTSTDQMPPNTPRPDYVDNQSPPNQRPVYSRPIFPGTVPVTTVAGTGTGQYGNASAPPTIVSTATPARSRRSAPKETTRRQSAPENTTLTREAAYASVSALRKRSKNERQKCVNFENGCPLILPLSQLGSHQECCEYINFKCPKESCEWNGRARKLASHVREAHRTEITTKTDCKHTLTGIEALEKVCFFQEVSRKLFAICVHCHGGVLYVSIQYIASGRSERPTSACGCIEVLGQDGHPYSWRGKLQPYFQSVESLLSTAGCLEVSLATLGAQAAPSITLHVSIRVYSGNANVSTQQNN